MSSHAELQTTTKAWVMFSGHADLAWLKILKPGFRHCAVLLNDGHNWITIDPLSNYTDITVHRVPLEFDLPLWMKDRGHKVVPAPIKRMPHPAPFAVYSCVEAVKRVLGIHQRLILTPWQLYRYLNRIQTIQTFTPKGDLAWEV
ncbi:MAG: hypothetical protein H6860_04245 [Rhodospirillales bacterium]|nr:hypothetical protein [Alphaproteobacteria bacterium]MCB9981590.1 hypothetical protein [Rhodospirillales bacterium]